MYAFGFTDPAHVSEDWGSIRSLAMQYVKEMQVIQPEGPYFMGGYSAGGLIALEMASILLEIKEQVGLLVLIDTFPWIPDARTNTKKILESISTGIDKVKVSCLQYCKKNDVYRWQNCKKTTYFHRTFKYFFRNNHGFSPSQTRNFVQI